MDRARSRVVSWLVASATALVILGATIAPFLTPAVVRLEQDRAGAGSLTGYAPAQLDAVTGALLGDLVLWRGDFDVAVDGTPVLTARERAHMRDVRGVFTAFWLLVGLSLLALVLAVGRARGTEARFAAWRAVAGGARALAIGLVVAGALVLLAFEAAFEVFHRLFFSAGSYTFDPARDRLVQLFPMAFWSEVVAVVGVVALAVAVVTAWQAGRRAAGHRPPARFLATSRAGS